MTHEAYIQGLREMAAFYEDHPEVPLPYEGTLCQFRIYGQNKETIAIGAKAFGHADKIFDGDSFELVKTFPSGQKLGFYTSREKVCERVVVGTKIEPAHTLPERIEAAVEVPERVVELVEWRCGSLLAPENEAANA